MKIESVRYLGKEDVYNMEVQGLHNYVTAGGSVLHNCVDAVRYYCVSRVLGAEEPEATAPGDEDAGHSYDDYMTGGEIPEEYMGGWTA